jgi:hypothetical protein
VPEEVEETVVRYVVDQLPTGVVEGKVGTPDVPVIVVLLPGVVEGNGGIPEGSLIVVLLAGVVEGNGGTPVVPVIVVLLPGVDEAVDGIYVELLYVYGCGGEYGAPLVVL